MARTAQPRSGRTTRRRHPSSGGYARGERTRRKIIETAIAMFGSDGYNRTSTRAIARRARVSLPALQYYFGGKQGLARACVELLTADVRARLDPALRQVREALATRELGRPMLLSLLRAALEPFFDSMATEQPESWVLFFTRAQHERGAVFDVIFELVAGRIIAVCTEIIGRLLELPQDRPEVLIRAFSVIGQVALVRRARAIILRMLEWPDLEGARLQLLKTVMWQNIAASLEAAVGTSHESKVGSAVPDREVAQ